ncbi:restriction system modified-DNA reader domain-containing protein [Ideonella dechloratans]|uniref:restriction system modified-DNA reader domain-containing protein n=1 Tax=Ideonella dechloratans TaxID=36863 RepID=UPI0035AEDD5D
MELVQVPVRREVFERLKALAEPLVDDASSVIERLIAHWETIPHGPRVRHIELPEPGPALWRSARGERFPVGAPLRAKYLGHKFEATVTASGIEFAGKTYDNPSSAGIAVKESVGTKGKAASTNGWDFWEMLDPASKRWVSINKLRTEKAG